MATTEKIQVIDHVGTVPVRDASGRVIATVQQDTGLKRVYYSTHGDGGEFISGGQVAFLHPNGFMHFIIPSPPEQFVDRIKTEIHKQGYSVSITKAPPSVDESEEDE